MKARLLLMLMLGLGWSALAQKETAYLTWLDSMASSSYIAMEITLDELQINHETDDGLLSTDKRRYTMRNTDQLLHHLPGVSMVRRGSFANEPMLRGLTSERYVLSIDGMRVFGACTDKMDPGSAYIEPISLDGIDVSFGGQGNMLGSTTGGSVNFNLKKPIFNAERPWMGQFSTNYGSAAGSFDQAVDFNYSKDRWAVRLSGVHRKAHNYTDGNGEEVRYSQYEKINYAGALYYRLTDNDLLTFDFVGDDAWDVGYPALPMDVSSAKAKMYSVGWIGTNLWRFERPEVKVYHNSIDHEMDDTNRDTVAMHMDMPGTSSTSGGYFKGVLTSSSRQQLSFKADYFTNLSYAEMTMYPNDPSELPMFMLTWPNIRRSQAGMELDYQRSLGELWQLHTTARLDEARTSIDSDFGERQLNVFGRSGTEVRKEQLINTSVNLSFRPGKRLTTTFKVSYGERVPSVSEQFGFYLFNVHDGHDYLGDPDLEKERNLHFEIVESFKSNRLQLDANLFMYRFDNYIMGIHVPEYQVMTIGAQGVRWYTNVGNATMLGGELRGAYELSRSSRLSSEMKYVYGKDFEDDPLPQMPPFKVNTAFDQQWLGINWRTELEWASAQHRVSEKFNEPTTPSYYLVNLRINKSFEVNDNSIGLGLGVDNLLNESYREHFDIGRILRPGRNFYIDLKARF